MRQMGSRRLLYACFAVAVCALLSHWFFHADILYRENTVFHLNRLMAIACGLAAGDFPVYVHGFQVQGYGTLDGSLYPDLLLYLPAVLVDLGVPLTVAWNMHWVFLACLGICAAWRGYVLLTGRTFLGLLAALLFSSCYGILMFLGSSAGGYEAGFFLPYAVGALFAVLRRADGARRWPELVLAVFVIAASHVISTVLCAAFLTAGLLLWRSGLADAARRRALLFAAGASLALLLYRLVPFIYFYRRVDFQMRHAVTPSLGTLTSPLSDLVAAQLWWGWPLLVLLCLALFSRAFRRRRAFLVTAALAVLLAAMNWSGFPWQAIERLPLLGRALPLFQFAFRFLPLGLVPLAYFLARYLAAAVRHLGARLPRGGAQFCGSRGLSLLLALLCVAYGMHAVTRSDFMIGMLHVKWQEAYVHFDGQSLLAANVTLSPNYAYVGIDPVQLFASDAVPRPNEVRALTGSLAVSSFQKIGTRLSFSYASEGGAEVQVPLFAYPGYEARVDGTAIAVHESAHHVLTLSLPAGEHTVFVRYRGLWSFRVSVWISLLSMVLFCYAAWYQWRSRRGSRA